MSELSPEISEAAYRCPQCDSQIQPGDTVCRMCGAAIPPDLFAAVGEMPASNTPLSPPPTATPLPPIVESQMRERQSRLTLLITAVITAITIGLAAIVLQNPTPLLLAIVPTPTPTQPHNHPHSHPTPPPPPHPPPPPPP
ncbi:MAG: zinc ribbon domain-containing protein, partial [Anaerolineales bacterium]|nr:zinc ribbon domain-containing protein [Anaerolineales bacterium]